MQIWTLQDNAERAIIEEITKQTDRGAAVIAASFLEARLLQAIKTRIIRHNRVENKLFKYPGPLATLSAKIDFALLIGVCSPELHRMLHLIREIRNEFAHKPEPRKFESEDVQKLCDRLKSATKAILETKDLERIKAMTGTLNVAFTTHGEMSPRARYLRAVQMLLFAFEMEIKMDARRPPPPRFPGPAPEQQSSPDTPGARLPRPPRTGGRVRKKRPRPPPP